jgi:hypothetical protein
VHSNADTANEPGVQNPALPVLKPCADRVQELHSHGVYYPQCKQSQNQTNRKHARGHSTTLGVCEMDVHSSTVAGTTRPEQASPLFNRSRHRYLNCVCA